MWRRGERSVKVAVEETKWNWEAVSCGSAGIKTVR